MAAYGDLGGKVFGFLGVGTINVAVMKAVLTQGDRSSSGLPAFPLRVSPRNAEKAAALVNEFGDQQVRICADNQSLLDECEVIVIGLKVPMAPAVLAELTFRPEHRIISLLASGDMSAMAKGAVPETQIVRVCPLPPIAKGRGVPIVYPPYPEVLTFFRQFSKVVGAETPEQMRSLQGMSTLMGPYYQLLVTCSDWLQTEGVPPETAATLVGDLMFGVAADAAGADTPKHFQDLVDEQTPGGLNEGNIKRLTDAGVFKEFSAALTNVRERLTPAEQPRPS